MFLAGGASGDHISFLVVLDVSSNSSSMEPSETDVHPNKEPCQHRPGPLLAMGANLVTTNVSAS